MSLEQQLLKKVLVKRTPTPQVIPEVKMGRKFIVVQDDFNPADIPDGYTLIQMRHRGDSFKSLIPQGLLYFMANPGEGDPNAALDEIADFYGNAKDFEEDMIAENATSVQEANWATLSRNSYSTYLVNRLVRHKSGVKENGEPVAEFDPQTINELDIADDFVSQRIKAIAALALKKDISKINSYEVRDVLKHVTIREKKTEKLTKEEFKKITCWAGSHYEIKDEYKNQDGVSYRIDKLHNQDHMVGEKITTHQDYVLLDSKVGELESQITEYRAKKHSSVGRHDCALIRQYINLAYIAKENKSAQLDIQPPIEVKAQGEKK